MTDGARDEISRGQQGAAQLIALAMFRVLGRAARNCWRAREYEYVRARLETGVTETCRIGARDAILRKSLHPSPLQRSISIRDSLVALSVHARLIRTPVAAAATRSEGAAGAAAARYR